MFDRVTSDRPSWTTPERPPFDRADTSMSERLMTYDEAAAALERWAVPQLAKRRRSRRTLGNDGKSPIAVPVEDLDTNPPDDLRPSDRAAPRRPPVVQTDTSDEAVRDARSLIVMLEARVAEMSGELKEARADLRQAQAVITDLTRKAARAEGLDALLAVERERIADLRADMDRWRSQAEQLAATTPEPKSSRSWWRWRRSA